MPHPSAAKDRPVPAWPEPFESLPALAAIRSLPPARLDALVLHWAEHRGLGAVRRADRRHQPATYWAFFGEPPFALPALVRVHQLKSRLQPRHVEAFFGQLLLAACDHGVLVTTGGASPEALRLARDRKVPRVRVISGPEWVRDLARWRAGVTRSLRFAWTLADPPNGGDEPLFCPRA